jgi:hypothetical protein
VFDIALYADYWSPRKATLGNDANTRSNLGEDAILKERPKQGFRIEKNKVARDEVVAEVQATAITVQEPQIRK